MAKTHMWYVRSRFPKPLTSSVSKSPPSPWRIFWSNSRSVLQLVLYKIYLLVLWLSLSLSILCLLVAPSIFPVPPSRPIVKSSQTTDECWILRRTPWVVVWVEYSVVVPDMTRGVVSRKRSNIDISLPDQRKRQQGRMVMGRHTNGADTTLVGSIVNTMGKYFPRVFTNATVRPLSIRKRLTSLGTSEISNIASSLKTPSPPLY